MTLNHIAEQLHIHIDIWTALRTTMYSFIIIIMLWYCNKLIKKALKKFEQLHKLDPMLAKTLKQCSTIAIYALGIILLLENLQIEISNGLRALSFTIVALGFGAQQIFASVIAGLFLLTYKSVAIGDYIICQSPKFEGKIIDINLHTTTLEHDGDLIKVPNQTLYTATITIKKNNASIKD